ncbi:MAG: hypothetical protein IJ292_03365 [Clostridia bacterium]|nr:hypothetical protein [Clostridia bacterium]
MKIMSTGKIALTAVLVAVLTVMSMMAVSAAPMADAGIANENYADAVTLSGNTVDALHEAMVRVETENADVIFTLTGDIALNPSAQTTYTVGTDATSNGKLIIISELEAGTPKYAITLGAKANLHIKGNVQFKDVKLSGVGSAFLSASYIFVTEGTGTFGDSADTTNYGNVVCPAAVSLAGSDLRVYSGTYKAVAANFAGSNMTVSNPTIVFGGTASTEHLVGRGLYTDANDVVAGNSTLTIEGNATVTNRLTAGYYRPRLTGETALGGNATLNMNGGSTSALFFVGYTADASDVANFAIDENTRSLYTININGGTVSSVFTTMYMFEKKATVKNVDVEVNIGNNVTYANRFVAGPWATAVGASVTDCKVTVNASKAVFSNNLYGGYINVATNADNKVVFDVDLVYNLGQTGKVTFSGDVKFGSFINTNAAYSEHKGDVEVKLWAANSNVSFSGSEIFAGSQLNAQNSKHTGDTKIEFGSKPWADYNKKSIYCGSHINAVNAEHSGTSTYISISGDSVNTGLQIFGGSKITKAGIHSGDSFVKALSGAPVSAAGNADLLNEGYVFGGSYLVATGAEHSGNSKVIFGDKATNKQGVLRNDTFGGSYIAATGAKHTGKSEILVEYGTIQNQCNVFGGSYLEVSGAVQEGASAVTIKERVSASTAVIRIYGGSYIKVDGAKHTGSSAFEFSAGTMNNVHGAGSYAEVLATDALSNDGINGGFAQGTVFYIVNGGSITVIPNIAGYNVNVDGDINVIITGGTIGNGTATVFSTLNNDKTKSVSVTGDLKLKISGGTLNFDQIYNGSLNANAAVGTDVVKGTYYAEFVNNEMVFTPVSDSITYFYPVGYNNQAANFAGSSLYIRFVGDFDCFNGGDLAYNFTSRVNHLTGDKILDYVQWTKNGQLTALGRGETIYRPMNGQNVTIDRIEALGGNVKIGDYTVKAGDTLTWSYGGTQISATYEALTAYDDLADYKNAPMFVDAVTGEGITTATRTIKLACGLASSSTVTPSNESIAEYIVSEYCKVRGASLRIGNLEMSCRVAISNDFFANFFESDNVTAKTFNGFDVKKIGILVSGEDYADLTVERAAADSTIINKTAWEEGVLNVNNWATDENDTDNLFFAATITNYEDEDGNVIKELANKTVYFRAYVELACGDDTFMVYLDNPRANDPDNTYTNYGRSLVEVARMLYEGNSQWLDESDLNRETVMEILAAVSTLRTFTVTSGANLFTYTATPLGDEGNETKYLLEFDVKTGYNIAQFKLNGEVYTLDSDNTIEVYVDSNSTIALTFARKTSAELEARRAAVVDKMQQITGVQYTVDKQYSFIHGSNTITLVPGVVYQGMPYSDNAPFSPDAFMDFITATNENGVHAMSFTVGNENFFPGNTCADSVFWSWAKVSSTISFFASSNMTEARGVYTVGDFDVQSTDISNGLWVNTADVCTRNGLDVMSNAYAFMVKGDAMQRITPSLGNHTILVGDVVVVYRADGTINPNASYILFYDQHGGYNTTPKAGLNGQNVITSCNYNERMYFSQLYNQAYLPVTCIELLEDAPLADVVFTDTEETLDFSTVTGGMIETNYALSKIEMVITNKATNEVYEAVRHGYESPRLQFYFASFNNNAGGNGAGKVENVYNDAILRFNLPSGNYTCVVTGYFSNGETEVIRNYEFTRP